MSRDSNSSFPLGPPPPLSLSKLASGGGGEWGAAFKSWNPEGPQTPPHHSEAQGSERALLRSQG